MYWSSIYKKNLLFISIMAIIASSFMVGCGDNDVTGQLSGNTYHMEIAPISKEYVDNCSAPYPVGIYADVIEEPLALHNSGYHPELNSTITFNDDGTFDMKLDGQHEEDGLWSIVDNDTLEISVWGREGLMDVVVEDDTLIVEFTQESADAFCPVLPESLEDTEYSLPPRDESEDDSVLEDPDDSSDVEQEETLTSKLDGTWCYKSGFNHYLAISIDTANSSNTGFATYTVQAAPIESNADYLEGISSSLIYASRKIGINEFHQTAWIRTESSQLETYADIYLDSNDENSLTVDYGMDKIADFIRSESAAAGECSSI